MTNVEADALLYVWKWWREPEEMRALARRALCERDHIFHDIQKGMMRCQRCGVSVRTLVMEGKIK